MLNGRNNKSLKAINGIYKNISKISTIFNNEGFLKSDQLHLSEVKDLNFVSTVVDMLDKMRVISKKMESMSKNNSVKQNMLQCAELSKALITNIDGLSKIVEYQTGCRLCDLKSIKHTVDSALKYYYYHQAHSDIKELVATQDTKALMEQIAGNNTNLIPEVNNAKLEKTRNALVLKLGEIGLNYLAVSQGSEKPFLQVLLYLLLIGIALLKMLIN